MSINEEQIFELYRFTLKVSIFPEKNFHFGNGMIRNDPEFQNNVPEISGLREKNRSGILDFRNLFHNGNGKNFRIISIRKP